MAFAAAVVIDVLAAKVMPVLLSPTLQALPLVKLPAKVTLLGSVAVTPPLKVKLSAAASPESDHAPDPAILAAEPQTVCYLSQ